MYFPASGNIFIDNNSLSDPRKRFHPSAASRPSSGRSAFTIRGLLPSDRGVARRLQGSLFQAICQKTLPSGQFFGMAGICGKIGELTWVTIDIKKLFVAGVRTPDIFHVSIGKGLKRLLDAVTAAVLAVELRPNLHLIAS